MGKRAEGYIRTNDGRFGDFFYNDLNFCDHRSLRLQSLLYLQLDASPSPINSSSPNQTPQLSQPHPSPPQCPPLPPIPSPSSPSSSSSPSQPSSSPSRNQRTLSTLSSPLCPPRLRTPASLSTWTHLRLPSSAPANSAAMSRLITRLFLRLRCRRWSSWFLGTRV
ncbi:hypothetical protein M011DRAFT_90120 [Sporormia fimetaria CBS 119925]|uniref:Uncharacterized protein n=1 Tax=Sporormia fimetaria CBS 119925 TaxID=1340428 RepID=A0A6A6V975_9PLEO|nr:hypothetical protein M011DRAFT_90120 [Sporormia fimetaria CBS 119925]